MAIVVTKDAGSSLKTASDFLKCEASNFGADSSTALTFASGATPRVIAITPASASANMKGIQLAIQTYTSMTYVYAASSFHDVSADLQEVKVSVTFDSTTDKITHNSHGYSNGNRVAFTGGTLPTTSPASLMVQSKIYFIVNKGTNDYQISLTSGGSAINFTNNGSGTITEWITRSYDQQTGTEMFNGVAAARGNMWLIDFKLDTPYAIDNTAGKWRWVVSMWATQTNIVALGTSDATNPYYVCYSDAAVSATDGTAATGTLTSDATNVAASETVVIDQKTYTFKTSFTPAEGDVQIGANAAASLANLKAAINHSGTPGVDYWCAQPHQTVVAGTLTATTLDLTARRNSYGMANIATTETSAHLSFGNTTLTGSTRGDQICVRTPLTIDCSYSAGGVLGTGCTYNATAIMIGKSLDPTVANVCMVKWENPASAPYTLTIDGSIQFGSQSGIQAGTLANPITLANRGILYYPKPTAGSQGGNVHYGLTYNQGCKSSFIFYGAVPTYEYSITTYDCAMGGAFSAATTDICTKTAHLLVTGMPVQVFVGSGGALPAGLSATTTYWVNVINSSTFYLYDTYAHSIAGGATGRKDITSTGTAPIYLDSVIITNDTTSWNVGDVVCTGGIYSQGGPDQTLHTIKAISGTSMTLLPYLTGCGRKLGHPITNQSNYGFRIQGGYGLASSYPYNYIYSPSNFVLSGVECDNLGSFYICTGGATNISNAPQDDAANMSKYSITHCAVYNSISAISRALIGGMEAPPGGIDMTYNYGGRCGALYNGIGVINVSSAYKSGVVLVDHNIVLCSNSSSFALSNTTMPLFQATITNNIWDGSYSSLSSGQVYLYGNAHNYSNNKHWGSNAPASLGVGALVFGTAQNITGSGNTFDNNAQSIFFAPGITSNIQFTANSYGQEYANTVDFDTQEGALIDYLETGCIGSPTVTTTNLAATADGSVIKIRNYNNTAGNYKSWHQYGLYYSSSGLLGSTTDTTHTHFTDYTFLTASVTGVKCVAIVSCQVVNAAYYGAAHTVPKITATYGTEAPVVGSAADSTTVLQTLSAIFNPATDNQNLVVRLSQQTAASSNNDVKWSNLTVYSRKYGYIFGSITKAISETIPYVYGEITTPVANSHITQTNSTTVASYSEFTINHATQTVTLSGATTLARLYDYAQYDLTLDANMTYAEWFTTTDGINYVSAYNIVDGGYALTGGGSINVGTLTYTQTGNYDGIIITSTNKIVHIKLNSIVSGSQYFVCKTSDGTQILNATAAGTSTDDLYTYTTDLAVTVRVRKAGYQEWTTTGTITSIGLTLTVGQSSDPTY
jgi:hypothetical protein